MVIQLPPSISMPSLVLGFFVLIIAPDSPVKVIGLPGRPLLGVSQPMTNPAYFPAATSTVSPATAMFAAFCSVLNGAAAEPGPMSLPVGDTKKLLKTCRVSSGSNVQKRRLLVRLLVRMTMLQTNP